MTRFGKSARWSAWPWHIRVTAAPYRPRRGDRGLADIFALSLPGLIGFSRRPFSANSLWLCSREWQHVTVALAILELPIEMNEHYHLGTAGYRFRGHDPQECFKLVFIHCCEMGLDSLDAVAKRCKQTGCCLHELTPDQ